MVRRGIRIFAVLCFFASIILLSIFAFSNETLNYFIAGMFLYFVIILLADIDNMHVCTKIAINFESECNALKENEQKALNEGLIDELESIREKKMKMKQWGSELINSDTVMIRFPYKSEIRKIIDRL